MAMRICIYPAEYRKATLPPPRREVADAVVSAVREITYIEGEKGKLPLSLGIRDSSMDIMAKVDTKEKQEKISLQFAP